MRFIVAERVGAIPAFRAAVGRQVAVLRAAVQQASEADGAAALGDVVADAVVVLLLEASGSLLDGGAQHAALVRDALLEQIRALVSGARRRAE